MLRLGFRTLFRSAISPIHQLTPITHSVGAIQLQPTSCSIQSPSKSLVLSSRSYSTIFTSVNATSLWEGVTGPKGSTKKRARGKRRVTRPKIDLNRGQRIGVGKSAVVWPGLTSSMKTAEGDVKRITQGKVDPEYEERIKEMRNKTVSRKKTRALVPIKRGWSGNKFGGQSIGPPEPTQDCTFDGFDTRVLELKVVSTMTATYGRTGRFSAFVVTGNGNGLLGFSLAKSTLLRSALRQAKKRAAQNLEMFHLHENRTIWHPAFCHEWNTKIIIQPMPPGYGLVCHRCIATICKVVGIKDIYCRVEGWTKNYQNITKGFLRLLRKQETYQDLANREQLHVVQINKDRDFVPQLLASPSQGITRSVSRQEDLDMKRYYFDGHVPHVKKRTPFYWNLDGNVKARYDRFPYRNMAQVRLQGDVYSMIHGGAQEKSQLNNENISAEANAEKE